MQIHSLLLPTPTMATNLKAMTCFTFQPSALNKRFFSPLVAIGEKKKKSRHAEIASYKEPTRDLLDPPEECANKSIDPRGYSPTRTVKFASFVISPRR